MNAVKLDSCDTFSLNSSVSSSSSSSSRSPPERVDSVRFKYKTDQEIHELPDPSSWPHRPLYLAPGDDTIICDTKTNSNFHSLPIGSPIEFQGKLFQGKMFMRLRNVPKTNQQYFKGRKRTKQIVIQGRFKEKMSCNDVWFGDKYDKPLKISSLVRMAIPIFKRLVPGVVLNIFSKEPSVMMLLGGECRTMSIDEPGSEPDMTGELDDHNTSLLGNTGTGTGSSQKKFKSIKQRRKLLRNPSTAKQYSYDPQYVYTFQFYDDIIDICDYSINLPFGKIPLLKFLNYQPMTFAAVTKNDKPIFSFKIFHEDLVESFRA